MAGSDEDVKPQEVVARLEKELELPDGFFQSLLKEDDWSFLIKLHALFEAAISYVVVHKLGCAALDGTFARMAMSGKIEFAMALGLIDGMERGFIVQLSQLRNRCVHNVREAATFNLTDTCAAMNADQKANFVRVICGTKGDEPFELRGERTTLREAILRNPKFFLWDIGMAVLACLHLQKETEEVRQGLLQQQRETYQLLKQMGLTGGGTGGKGLLGLLFSDSKEETADSTNFQNSAGA